VRREGQALLEFALVLPLLVGILISALLLARVLWSHQVVWALAGEAARAGALGTSAADADQRARNRAGQMAEDASLDPGRLTLGVDTRHFGRGGWVLVSASYHVLQLAPIGPLAAADTWVVDAEAREPVDRFRSGIAP
jgi:Flp pilus assembly protein TadG